MAEENSAPDEQQVDADQEQIAEQLEEEIRKVRMEDLVLQSAVSMLNLAARRIGKEDERDLDQARIGIDAAEALLPQAPEEARPQLEQAVSELKLAFAKAADAGESTESAPEAAATPEESKPGEPGEGNSGLWTPGSGKS